MRTSKVISLQGYTVQGIDLRDNSSFEDFCVRELGAEPIDKLHKMYAEKGYRVERMVEQETFATTLDLFELYMLMKNKPQQQSSLKLEHPQTEQISAADGKGKKHKKGPPPIWSENSDKPSHEANRDEAAEKKRIVTALEQIKLRAGRPGLRQIIRYTGNKITECMLDSMIARERHPVDKWLLVGAAVDKFLANEAAEKEKAG